MSATRKRLSCDRCHAQKLRCPRHSSADEQSCGRCFRHGTKCVYSVALPKGRPRSKPESFAAIGSPARNARLAAHGNGAATQEDTQAACLDDTRSLSPGSLQRNPAVLDDSFTMQPLSSRAGDHGQGRGAISAGVNFLGFSPVQSTSWHDSLQGCTEPPQPVTTSLASPEEKHGEHHRLDRRGRGSASQDKPAPYVERSFWGRIESQEPLRIPSADGPHIPTTESTRPVARSCDEADMLNLVEDIPSKAICDTFIQSFISAVYPLHPLVDIATLCKDYDILWDTRPQKVQSWRSGCRFIDPTVLTVLFAALYCGAAAIPTSLWPQPPALRRTDRSTLLDKLGTVCNKALDRFRRPIDTTLNTLTASLLYHCFAGIDETTAQAQSFVSTAVCTAQSMGLHRDITAQGLNTATQELRRRIWWHIVWLDVRCSLQYGSQMHCGAERYQWDVQVLRDPALDPAEEARPVIARSPSISTSHKHSVPLRFAVGMAEVARFLHSLLLRVNSCYAFGQADLNIYLKKYKRLHTKLALIIAALGEPNAYGQGQNRDSSDFLISSRESPHDSEEQPAVFIPWAKIALVALVKGSLMVLQKTFLGHASLTVQQNQMLWTSTSRLSIDVLVHGHEMVHLARSSTQLWFLKTNLTPLALAATFVILCHIKHVPAAEHSQEALEVVDGTLNLFSLVKTLPGMEPLGTPPGPASFGEEADLEWQPLKAMRAQIAAMQPQPTPETCGSSQSSGDHSTTWTTSNLSTDSAVPRSFSRDLPHLFLEPPQIPGGQIKAPVVVPTLTSMIQDIQSAIPGLGAAAYRGSEELQAEEGWPVLELAHRGISSDRAAHFSSPENLQQDVPWCSFFGL